MVKRDGDSRSEEMGKIPKRWRRSVLGGLAGKAREQKETIYEMAALLYHGRQMVEAGRIGGTRLEEPSRRHIIDHKVKQEKMTQ